MRKKGSVDYEIDDGGILLKIDFGSQQLAEDLMIIINDYLFDVPEVQELSDFRVDAVVTPSREIVILYPEEVRFDSSYENLKKIYNDIIIDVIEKIDFESYKTYLAKRRFNMRRKGDFRKKAFIDLPEEAKQRVIDVIKDNVDEIEWDDGVRVSVMNDSINNVMASVHGRLSKEFLENLMNDLRDRFDIDADANFLIYVSDRFFDMFEDFIQSKIKARELDIVYNSYVISYLSLEDYVGLDVYYNISKASIIFE